MKPGIYHGIANADYHADRSAIGCSGLKAMLKTPAYYFGQYLDPDCPPEPEVETPGRKFGNMVHAVLFEHHLFNERYKVGPDVTSRATKEWKDWAKENLYDGCQGIKPAEYKAAMKVRESVLAIPDMARALATGRGEVSAYWDDPATGVLCKCRPDWVYPVNDDSVILLDGKTFASADEEDFSRQVAKMNYFLQAAWYTDGYALASGKKVLGFIFLVIADDYPHLANPMMLDDDSLDVGRRKYRQALNLYAECRRTGAWPSYSPDVKLITLPTWAKDAT